MVTAVLSHRRCQSQMVSLRPHCIPWVTTDPSKRKPSWTQAQNIWRSNSISIGWITSPKLSSSCKFRLLNPMIECWPVLSNSRQLTLRNTRQFLISLENTRSVQKTRAFGPQTKMDRCSWITLKSVWPTWLSRMTLTILIRQLTAPKCSKVRNRSKLVFTGEVLYWYLATSAKRSFSLWLGPATSSNWT